MEFAQDFNIATAINTPGRTEATFDYLGSNDIQLVSCGILSMKAADKRAEAVTDAFEYYFVVSGKGLIVTHNREYRIAKNVGFMHFPRETLYFQASDTRSWKLVFFTFKGIRVARVVADMGISLDSPFVNLSSEETSIRFVSTLYALAQQQKLSTVLSAYSALYGYLSYLANELYEGLEVQYRGEISASEKYTNDALYYIEQNYNKNITVRMIADHVGINQSYLSRLFKRTQNVSPVVFLVNYRLEMALRLLQRTKKNIKQVSFEVGFDDPSYFSKCFTKKYGITPKKARDFSTIMDKRTPPTSMSWYHLNKR